MTTPVVADEQVLLAERLDLLGPQLMRIPFAVHEENRRAVAGETIRELDAVDLHELQLIDIACNSSRVTGRLCFRGRSGSRWQCGQHCSREGQRRSPHGALRSGALARLLRYTVPP